jgi:hypothetical protein
MMNRTIGIDPGKKTAIAVYDSTLKRIVDVFNTDFWGAIEYLQSEQNDTSIKQVIIEVPRTKTNWHKKGCDITSANVGGIYREATLLADGIERMGLKVIRQHPQGKVGAAYVKKITGYQGRTNQHTRDSIMLCWGF